MCRQKDCQEDFFFKLREVVSYYFVVVLLFVHSFFFLIFVYLLLTVPGLRCCRWTSSCCSEGALCSSRCMGASHCSAFSCGAQVLGRMGFRRASAVAARGLGSCSPRALEQRLNSCGTLA